MEEFHISLEQRNLIMFSPDNFCLLLTCVYFCFHYRNAVLRSQGQMKTSLLGFVIRNCSQIKIQGSRKTAQSLREDLLSPLHLLCFPWSCNQISCDLKFEAQGEGVTSLKFLMSHVRDPGFKDPLSAVLDNLPTRIKSFNYALNWRENPKLPVVLIIDSITVSRKLHFFLMSLN